jgi:S-adenosylmethionine decarboxylase
MADHWGYHLILDIAGCEVSKATDPDHIRAFTRALVKEIDMIAYGEPQVVHFAEHCNDKAGWTLIQLIETSNIMAHFIDSSGDCYMDIFSCKPFDANSAVDLVKAWFTPANISSHYMTRKARS